MVVLCLGIGLKNPVFFTAPNAVSLLQSLTVYGIMAFALMLGIIIGGIDVSFPATAVVSMYLVNKVLESIAYDGPAFLPILAAVAIGTLLGLVNGFLITKFDLPAFIVTLGTSSVFHGLLVFLLGGKPVNRLVAPLEALSKMELLRVESGGTSRALPVTFLFLMAVMVVVWFILNKTMLGRMIYAIGGDRISAQRAGFPVKPIIIFVYAFIGFAAGLAGIVHSIQARLCIPTDLMGCEMTVIAMVVLGGTKISGGRGTVLGTFLGLAIITITQNSLILVGIPSTWQQFAVGVVIVAGTGISAYQALRNSRKIAPVMSEEHHEHAAPAQSTEGGAVNG